MVWKQVTKKPQQQSKRDDGAQDHSYKCGGGEKTLDPEICMFKVQELEE